MLSRFYALMLALMLCLAGISDIYWLTGCQPDAKNKQAYTAWLMSIIALGFWTTISFALAMHYLFDSSGGPLKSRRRKESSQRELLKKKEDEQI